MKESKICPICGNDGRYGFFYITEDNNLAITCGGCGHKISSIEALINDELANQAAKQDAGKPRLSLVPSQIIWDIAQVREYGNVKYHDPDNWRTVELERYIDALYRHFLRFLDDPHSIDEESGLEHYKHMACTMAFICAMLAQGKEE